MSAVAARCCTTPITLRRGINNAHRNARSKPRAPTQFFIQCIPPALGGQRRVIDRPSIRLLRTTETELAAIAAAAAAGGMRIPVQG